MTSFRDEFLSEEDLDLSDLSEAELFAWWDLWLHQAQATNDVDANTYSHGVFTKEPTSPPLTVPDDTACIADYGAPMYIAMNRFRITKGHEADFETVWRERESGLAEVPGFLKFQLLRGETGDEETTFISVSGWEDQAAFQAWTKSEAFAKAHRSKKSPEGVLRGPPRFEGFEVVDL